MCAAGRLYSRDRGEYYLISCQTYTSNDSKGYTGKLRIVKNYSDDGYEVKTIYYTARCYTQFDDVTYVSITESEATSGSLTDVRRANKKPGRTDKHAHPLYWAAC